MTQAELASGLGAVLAAIPATAFLAPLAPELAQLVAAIVPKLLAGDSTEAILVAHGPDFSALEARLGGGTSAP